MVKQADPFSDDGASALELRLARTLGEYHDRYAFGELSNSREEFEAILADSPDLAGALGVLQEIHSLVEEPAPSCTYGDFELFREAGRGAMGIVFEAHQISLDRRVALKVLRGGLVTHAPAVTRFEREARVAASLDHPNIVGVHSMGFEGDTPYYTMEFVEGETLKDVLRRMKAESMGSRNGDVDGPSVDPSRETHDAPASLDVDSKTYTVPLDISSSSFEPSDRAAVGESDHEETVGAVGPTVSSLHASYYTRLGSMFAEVAEGLHYAHGKKIVHRDLKPSNLILDSRGRLRILDFGVARVDTDLSQSGTEGPVGTLLYMSPEQARGPRGNIGPGADIYGLGATLYEMLVWRPPFAGGGYQETLARILERDPTPLRKCNPQVPDDLETIVLKCLHKDPRERYATAEAVAQDLHRFVRGDPIEARPQTVCQKLVRRFRRNRWKIVQAAAACLLVFFVGMAAVDYLNELDRENEGQYRNLVEQGVFYGIYGLREQLLSPTLHMKVLDHDEFLGSSPEPSHRTSQFHRASDLLEARPEVFEAGWAVGDDDVFEKAVNALKEAVGKDSDRPDAYYHLAVALFRQHKRSEAMDELEAALSHDPGFAPALNLKVWILENAKDPGADQARAELEKVLESHTGWSRMRLEAQLAAQRALMGHEWKEAAEAFDLLENYDRIAWSVGRWPKRRDGYAGENIETLVGGGLAHFTTEPQDQLRALSDFISREETVSGIEPDLFLAKVLYVNAGNPDQALWLARRAHQKAPGSLEATLTLGTILVANGKIDEARGMYERAIDVAPEDPDLLVGLGVCLAENDLPAARLKLEAALKRDPDHSSAQYNLARVLTLQGRYDDAEHYYEKAIEADTDVDNPLALNNLGTLYDRRGAPNEARPLYRRATEVAPSFTIAHYNLGWALARQRRWADAAEAFLKALRLGLDNASLHSKLAMCLQRLGRGQEAIRHYDRALETTDPSERHVIYHDLGTALFQVDNAEAAMRLRQALLLDPECVRSRLNLAWILDDDGERSGDPLKLQEADDGYLTVLRQDPDNVDALINWTTLRLRESTPVPEGEELAELIRQLEDGAVVPGVGYSVPLLLAKYREAYSPGLASYASIDAVSDSRRILVSDTEDWRYQKGRVDSSHSLEWTALPFDDTSWEEAPGPFGYPATSTLGTVLRDMRDAYTSVYFRRRFSVEDRGSLRDVVLSVNANCGLVAFLNGKEVARLYVDPDETRLPYDKLTDEEIGDPWIPRSFPIDPEVLREGENILAIHAVNSSLDSEGFSLGAVLSAPAAHPGDIAHPAFEGFKAEADPETAAARIAYFEGRLAELDGDPESAREKYQAVLALDRSRPEPYLRLAECSRTEDDLWEADRLLREALESGLHHRLLWDAWLRSGMIDLKRTPEEMLSEIRQYTADDVTPDARASDLAWLLETLADGGVLRINCGSVDYVSDEGVAWRHDCFFVDGVKYYLARLDTLEPRTEDRVLHAHERYFTNPEHRGNAILRGYAVPLPEGDYFVTLHFAEGYFEKRGERVFDVLLEGETVLEEYEPLAKGFGEPDKYGFPVKVADGTLNIDFRRRVDNPKISALEIERL